MAALLPSSSCSFSCELVPLSDGFPTARTSVPSHKRWQHRSAVDVLMPVTLTGTNAEMSSARDSKLLAKNNHHISYAGNSITEREKQGEQGTSDTRF